MAQNQVEAQIPSGSDANPNQDVPIRSYLDQTIVPLMLEGLAEISKQRPERPVEFLADYLEKNNTERQGQQAQAQPDQQQQPVPEEPENN